MKKSLAVVVMILAVCAPAGAESPTIDPSTLRTDMSIDGVPVVSYSLTGTATFSGGVTLTMDARDTEVITGPYTTIPAAAGTATLALSGQAAKTLVLDCILVRYSEYTETHYQQVILFEGLDSSRIQHRFVLWRDVYSGTTAEKQQLQYSTASDGTPCFGLYTGAMRAKTAGKISIKQVI